MIWAALLWTNAHAWEGWYRQPDLHGDTVIFTSDGDLWRVSAQGGLARRLTAQPGVDQGGFFSPDGAQIAFTSDLDGNLDAYVMPAEGGEPRRLTWHPGFDEVIGWTPDGRVLFRSTRSDPNGAFRVFSVSPDGDEPVEVPVGWAARLDIEAGTGRIAMTRIGRENATWKRYRGGSADDIWVGLPTADELTQVTTFPGADSFPMWSNGQILFASDQGGTTNLWTMAPDGTGRTPLTTFTDWDVRHPARADDGRVAFLRAGDVWIWEPTTASARRVPIELPGERRLARVRYPAVAGWLESFSLAPNGDRVLVGTRGELFSVPVEDGVTLPVTATSGARERWGTFDAKGERVLYVTDASGEEAIARADAWGRGPGTAIVPPGTSRWHFPLAVAPSNKAVAWSDQTHRLWVAPLTAAGAGAPREVDRSPQAEITDYAWSPDGRWLAYALRDEREMSQVRVWDLATGERHEIGTGTTSDRAPAWDPAGRYLYWVSSRVTNPVFSARDMQAVELQTDVPMVALLRPDVPNPFADNAGLPPAPQNPAPQAKAEKAKKDKVKADKKRAVDPLDATEVPVTPVSITWEGLTDRVAPFPVAPGSYHRVAATQDVVYWIGRPPSGAADATPPSSLWAYSLHDRQLNLFATGVDAFDLPMHGASMALVRGGNIAVVSATATGPGDPSAGAVDLSNVVAELDPAAEWRQIFFEAWRLQRDFFWDPALGGVAWEAERDRYAALLPRISTRGELTDLLGELIGELGTSHTYVWGGDPGQGGRWTSTGQLGAALSRVATAAHGPGLRIDRIYRADPLDGVPSPLLEPGVGVREGEIVVAVQHQPLRVDQPIEATFVNLAGRRVVLTVAADANATTTRDVAVTLLYDDAALRYADHTRATRAYVAERTAGKVGYLHVPDMGVPGLIAFERWLYPQSDKDGLIVDVRWNRGGFVSQLLLEKLRRPILGFHFTRGGAMARYPAAARGGPFVVLTNGFAGSDGDIFPRAVQLEGLAPVIGERSWGGVVGIRMDKALVDGGALAQPEYAFWFRESGWGVENHGVDPDIVVPWGPRAAARGLDPQIDRAIDEVLARIAAEPPLQGGADPKPRKDRAAYEDER
jgi:tricorn protease